MSLFILAYFKVSDLVKDNVIFSGCEWAFAKGFLDDEIGFPCTGCTLVIPLNEVVDFDALNAGGLVAEGIVNQLAVEPEGLRL